MTEEEYKKLETEEPTMTIQLTEEEVQELERRHQENRTPIAHVGTGFCVACEADWPCPTARLVAERREREAKLAAYERRERHVCGDPSAECDGDCAHEGWQAIEARNMKLRAEEAEAKLARVKKLREVLADPS